MIPYIVTFLRLEEMCVSYFWRAIGASCDTLDVEVLGGIFAFSFQGEEFLEDLVLFSSAFY